MQKKRKKLIPALLLAAILLLALRHLSVYVLSDAYVWQAADTLRAALLLVAFSLALVYWPWRPLPAKCLIAAFVGYFASEIILCSLWYFAKLEFGFVAVGAIQGAAFFGAALIYLRRSYDLPSDQLEPGYLYAVRKIPSNTQDFLISLAGCWGPNGGYSLWADGYIYKYSRGRLVRHRSSILPADMYQVQKGPRLTNGILDDLGKLEGLRWTLRRNCLTVLGSIWRRHARLNR